jgi:hypothetical protein
VGNALRRTAALALILCVLAGLATASTDARVLFTIDTHVPGSVQQFAWRVIETRCNFHQDELSQRAFWVYDARATSVDAAVLYSIKILSEVSWEKAGTTDLHRDDGPGRWSPAADVAEVLVRS